MAETKHCIWERYSNRFVLNLFAGGRKKVCRVPPPRVKTDLEKGMHDGPSDIIIALAARPTRQPVMVMRAGNSGRVPTTETIKFPEKSGMGTGPAAQKIGRRR